MSNYFQQKRVWITGASSGIGEALALAFSEYQCHLVLSGRNEKELNRVAAACADAGAASVLVQALDLAAHAQIPVIAADVLKKAGKIDFLINNGGISQRALALETTLEVDKRVMDVNFFGTVALTKAVLPHMLTHQLGHIVTITSLTGKFGSPYRSSYAASKHALHGFFDSLRAELGDSPVKITLICPGFVRTNVSVNALTGDGSKLGSMDDATDKGMEPQHLARKILNALAQQKEEVYFGGKEVLGVYVKRFFPRYFSKLIKKAKVR
jgi:dehydrogenase/reductase SDR family member 7B